MTSSVMATRAPSRNVLTPAGERTTVYILKMPELCVEVRVEVVVAIVMIAVMMIVMNMVLGAIEVSGLSITQQLQPIRMSQLIS